MDVESIPKEQAFPGDVIALAEEYIPGRNSTDENGEIVSNVFGEIVRDDQELNISVRPYKERQTIHRNDIAYARVLKVDQRRASLRIGAIYNRKMGLVSYDAEVSLGLGGRFSRGPPLVLRIGDLIRVRVLRTGSRGIELGIYGDNLGVLRTTCYRCRNILELKNGALYCENCDKTEMRKVAPDYGNINFEEE
ncbi:MAG: exosome complex RNA-binding protein Csl4 [Candidatus Thermoplasmatota archaeon]|jgi:exosome complex component CSL4|nr:exosome complex RNA-binding protein Csl4 [Candidatus Thermoplasmatota archaeon]